MAKMKTRTSVMVAASAVLLIASTFPVPALSDAPPNPKPVKLHVKPLETDLYRRQLGEPEQVLEVQLKGSSEYSWYETMSGHTVSISKTDGEAHYMDVDDDTGSLYETDCIVGKCNPNAYGIYPHAVDDEEQILFKAGPAARRDRRVRLNPIIKRFKDRKKLRARGDGSERKRKLRGGGGSDGTTTLPTSIDGRALFGSDNDDYTDMTMNNLVILIRWSDHRNRVLPSKQDIEVLFNQKGGDNTLAPTGSVRDCFLFNSYNSFDMVSTVTDWIDLPFSEAEVADTYYGMTGVTGDAIQSALDKIEHTIDWSKFDGDGDGEIDSIAVIHSGFAAEAAEPDCYTQADPLDRIWSHKWSMSDWYSSSTNTLVKKYHISPALWGSCNANIVRIGVICHETGHFLGAPDIYDGTGGNGIGSWGMMGNSWGFPGDQYYPPMMSPWTKIMLGWLDPVVIKSSGQYNAIASYQGDKNAYVIVRPDVDTEYFIIENRVRTATSFDAKIPQEGLLIWHIDDKADINEEGHPGLSGWPESGDHYRVAVVQADGEFQLEKSESRGDGSDLFYKGGPADEIGPNGAFKEGQLISSDVNTNWYQRGNIVDSTIRIYEVGYPGHTVSFKVEMASQGGSSYREVGGDSTGNGPQQVGCFVNGERCNANDECCSRHTCKPTRKGRGPDCCKLRRSRKKNRNAANARNKKRKRNNQGRALGTGGKSKRRITPLH